MKRDFILKSISFVFMLAVCEAAPAQGFLKKLGKTAKTVTSVASEVVESTPTSDQSDEDTVKATPIAWDSIPTYHAAKVYQTDESGNRLKNSDGTDIYKVLLVDQYGNIRSAEAVEAQHNRIKKQINAIWAKIGTGAASGAVSGLLSGKGLKGAAVGAGAGVAVGLMASIGNISNVKKERKNVKEQEKLIAAYQENFTDDGDLKNASVDPDKIEDLGLKSDNDLTMTAEKVKSELASESFKNADNSILDTLDGLDV